MISTQKRNGTSIDVILCGGPLAPVSLNGYAGCNGTGWFRSPSQSNVTNAPGEPSLHPRRCYRCESWGYQSKSQFFRNIAYDRRAEARLAREMANES